MRGRAGIAPAGIRRLAMLAAFAGAALAWCPVLAEEGEPDPPQPVAEVKDEATVRKRFFDSFTRAEKSALKADAVLMLRGVREKESLRILTGLLGDGNPDVRRNACRVMADIPDLDGYLVKSLMGAIFDRDRNVRRAAVDAIAGVQVKAGAIKSLINMLVELGEAEEDHALAYAAHRSLEKLTGHTFKDAQGVAGLAAQWRGWWKEFREEIEKADEKFLRLPMHLRERVAERNAEATKKREERDEAIKKANEQPPRQPPEDRKVDPEKPAPERPAPAEKAEDTF